MNIFYLSECPVESAQSQCDKHVVKMILESAQMLCTAHHACPSDAERPEKFYKQAHLNHPSTIWVRTTTANYEWMVIHALALCEEYTHRYGKVHSCEKAVLEAGNLIPFTLDRPKSFAFAGPDEFKYDTSIDIFTAYKYYIRSKPWVSSNYLRDPSRKPSWV